MRRCPGWESVETERDSSSIFAITTLASHKASLGRLMFSTDRAGMRAAVVSIQESAGGMSQSCRGCDAGGTFNFPSAYRLQAEWHRAEDLR
jgi:hypothetical protein